MRGREQNGNTSAPYICALAQCVGTEREMEREKESIIFFTRYFFFIRPKNPERIKINECASNYIFV